MIPLKLTIEGLYSYQERQTIDFELLTSSGLFGILGGVGSGKSAILEAMTYALYGETERLNNRDRRAYNMLNLKSDRAFIEFDFENFEGEVYRCTRELRRNSRNHEDVKTYNTTFYKYKSGNWQPLDHTNAEMLIGLSYTNFKRTIIIPQGQFKEFLELGAAGRTQMMKEIFQLERFDLLERTNSLNKTNQSELDKLEGQLKGYEAVSETEIEEKTKAHKEAAEQLEKFQAEFQAMNLHFEKLKQLKADYDKWQEKTANLTAMNEKLPVIETKEQELNRYERIFKNFSSDVVAYRKLQKELEESKTKSEELSNEKQSLLNSLNEKLSEITEIKPWFDQLSEKRQEENDLNLLVQVVEAKTKITETEARCEKGENLLLEVESQRETLKGEIDGLEKESNELQKQRIASDILVAVSAWFTENDSKSKLIDDKKALLANRTEELYDLIENIKNSGINLESFEAEQEQANKKLSTQEEQLKLQRDELNIQQKLAEYSHDLQDGKACPLCGSTEHPQIAHAEDVSAELEQLTQTFEALEQEKAKWQEKNRQFIRFTEQKKSKEKELNDTQNELADLEAALKSHQSNFAWSEFNAADKAGFEQKKAVSLQTESKISEIAKQLKAKREDFDNAIKKQDEYRNALTQLRTEISNAKTIIENNRQNLRVLKLEDYADKSKEVLAEILEKLNQKNNRIELQNKQLTDAINELNPKIASAESLLADLQKRLIAAEQTKSELKAQLETKLAAEQLENIATVEEILVKELDTTKEREAINRFRLDLGILKNEVESLQKRLEAEKYDNATFAEAQEKWEEVSKRNEAQKELFLNLKSELDNLKKRLEEKKDLLKEQEKISKRGENLRLMRNLFIGAGFVQYISTIYLTQLCDHANIRFHRMTRNQLSLQLNESGDFEIIDYLNEGRSRSVKTLSGGQAFQVSLSLALALAESVQTNARADKNFFFIDEGFGTQDLESVNIVFETLLNLNKENKIVGIISHVEELKERIPMTLNIEKDPERGSLIS